MNCHISMCHSGKINKTPKEIYHQKLRSGFYNAISAGNIKKLKMMIKVIDILQPGFLFEDKDGLIQAESNICFTQLRNEEVIHSLFTVDDCKISTLRFITLGKDTLFKTACTNGNLKVINFLLTSPDVKVNFKLKDDEVYYSIYMAFMNKHIDIVDYLLFSKELKENVSIDDIKNAPFFKKDSMDGEDYFRKEDFLNGLDKLAMLKELEEKLENNDTIETIKPKL